MPRSTPPDSTPGTQGDGAPEFTGSAPDPRAPSATEGEDLSSLRRLLLGEDRDSALDRLVHDGGDVDALAEMLPRAIERRQQQDDALSRSLAQTIESGIKTSVERDPQPLIDAIFPVIGPAIRRAVRSALASLQENVNQTVKYGLSWKGLRWRLEAWRNGVSFGEIVLRHTLLYRVEQVLLFHRESGLLLQQVAERTVEMEDPALVSSMLSAISQFVDDSFDVEAGESLDSIEMGDLTVWAEAGPNAVLAAVIRGHPPEALRETLHEALEKIHRDYRAALIDFSGDNASFVTAQDVLKTCLGSRQKEAKGRTIPWQAVVVLLAVLGLLAWWAWSRWQQGERERDYLETLRQTPGIEVLETDHGGGRLRIIGLRDAGAPDPRTLLSASGLDSSDVSGRWLPFHSGEPEMVAARVARIAGLPEGVTFSASDDGVVRVSGVADTTWAPRVRALLPTLDHVRALDVSGVVTPLDAAIERVEDQVISFFGTAGAAPPTAELEDVRREILALSELAESRGETGLTLRIIGHADDVGTEASNRVLSVQRAWAVREALGKLELPVEIVGRGSAEALASGASPESRRVTFEVVRLAALE